MKESELINTLKEVEVLLRNNNYFDQAKEISELSKRIKERVDSKKTLKEIKEKIISRCHVRWLGDLYIKEFKGTYDWQSLLSKLRILTEEL